MKTKGMKKLALTELSIIKGGEVDGKGTHIVISTGEKIDFFSSI